MQFSSRSGRYTCRPIQAAIWRSLAEHNAQFGEVRSKSFRSSHSLSECDWASFPFEFLVRCVLQRQHEQIRECLYRLQRDLAFFDNLHNTGDRSRGLSARLAIFFFESMDDMAEEECVFPDLLHLEQAYLGEGMYCSRPLSRVLNKFSHWNDRRLQQLRKICNQASPDHKVIREELEFLECVLLDHLRLEDEIVFPRAASMEAELFRYSG